MCVYVCVRGRKTRSKAAAIVLVKKKKKKEFGSWPLSAAYIKYVAAAGGMGWGLLKRVWKEEEEEGAEARSRFSRGL